MPPPPAPPHPLPPLSASEWLRFGHETESRGGTAANLLTALDCYDRARERFRDDLSASRPGTTSEHLGLAWLNRGNILQTLARPGDLEAALAAYTSALAAFAAAGDPTTPTLANRTGTAWLNRGHTQLRRGLPNAAVADFTAALTHLRIAIQPGCIAPARNAAGTALNLAQIHLDSPIPDHPAALDLAHEARDWVSPFAGADSIAATLTLESIRITLVATEPSLSLTNFGDFTDTVEAGLALAAAWIHRQHPTATAAATHLFRLGAAAYAQCQPQFLLEFLRDALDPSVGPAAFARIDLFHGIAAESLDNLLADLNRPRLLSADDETSHNLARLIHLLHEPKPWLFA